MQFRIHLQHHHPLCCLICFVLFGQVKDCKSSSFPLAKKQKKKERRKKKGKKKEEEEEWNMWVFFFWAIF